MKKIFVLLLLAILATPAWAENSLLEVPEIKSISFEQGNREEGGVVVVSGKNFYQYGGKTTLSIRIISPDDDSEMDFSDNIISVGSDKILLSISEDMHDGEIYVEVSYLSETAESNHMNMDISSPKIDFIYGKDGILPGKKVEIHGTNFMAHSHSASFSSENLKAYKVLDDVMYLILPQEYYDENIKVESGGLNSNEININSLYPPILTSVIFNKKDRKFTFRGRNIPSDASLVNIDIDGSAKTPDLIDSDYIELTVSDDIKPSSLIKLTVKEVDSNSLIYQLSSFPVVKEVEFVEEDIIDDKTYYVLDISLKNVDENDFKIKIDGSEISSDKVSIKNQIARVYTENFGEIVVVSDGYESYPFEFEHDTEKTPFIYLVESAYGFHEGVQFNIRGINFGNKSSDLEVNSPYPLSKNFGHDGYKLKSSLIEAMFSMPETAVSDDSGATTPNTTTYTTEVSSKALSVSVVGVSSNIINIPFGTTNKQIIYAPPLISGVEFVDNPQAGGEILIRGSNFAGNKNQNKITLGDEELEIKSVNSSGTKIETTLPEDAKSGDLVLEVASRGDQESPKFPIIISSSLGKEASVVFEEEEDEELETEGVQKEMDLAKLTIINPLGNLVVSRFIFDVNFDEGEVEEDYSLEKLKLAPFSEIYLLKNSEIIAGPAEIKNTTSGIKISFPSFVLPITEEISGDEYIISGIILPFAGNNSSVALSFTPDKTHFLADDKNGEILSLQNKNKIISKKTTIINPLIYCIDDDEESCDEFLSAKEKSLENGAILNNREIREFAEEEKIREVEEEKIRLTEEEKNKADPDFDFDGDGISNIEEEFLGTNPEMEDTDFDGSSDSVEIQRGTSPLENTQESIFSDMMQSTWSIPYITKLALFGVIDQDEENFRPNEAILRGDFVCMSVNAIRTEALPTVATNPFIDVPKTHKCAQEILYAQEKRVVQGYSDKTFRPDSEITRAEAMKILLSLKEITPSYESSEFEDLDSWQIPYVEEARTRGIVQGFSKKEFRPNSSITRAESAKIIYEGIEF